ncbi:RNA polymerase sigma factor [Hoylesella timonensis]|uniref:RNA polymerase sigma factor n=1 Tax=Hoylesella timonensis TaxID=386414 RepID=UPI00336A737C
MTDRKQLASLFKQHYREMYRLASIMLHDDVESKDIVHDVFAYILESGKDLKADTAVAYLMTSVRNRCLNRIRNMEIQERVERLYLLDQELEQCQEPRKLEEEIKALEKELERIQPPRCREILLMHYHGKHTFKEIAQMMGISETAVYKHLRHAMKQLREQLKKGRNGKD